MFFPDKITKITSSDKVLEVGPGGFPHPRADVLLDKKFNEETETIAQRGYAPKPKLDKEVIYYDGGIFPFKDKEFDYVICSHVLEHVPEKDLALFISELQRVANAGFIEFPTVFYELINHQDVHIWYMNYRNDCILFLNKGIFTSNYIHKTIREMFYGKDKYMSRAFNRYRELFFSYFEWKEQIKFKIIYNYDDLINEEDYDRHKEYFTHFKLDKYTRQSVINLLKEKIFIVYSKLRNAKKGL